MVRVVVVLSMLLALIAPAHAASPYRGYMDAMFGPPPGVELTPNTPEHMLQYQADYVSHPMWLRQVVNYRTDQAPGTVIVDTRQHFLFLVMPDGKAMRYGIGVARTGFEWSGTHRVTNKREWPSWTPPAEMHARQPGLPTFMPGGPNNPMGARALYLGSTLYRIHGTNEPWTIGRSVSSGCIRMTNQDVIDLYGRVPVGARVVVI
ncbi:L,D-transpeptidase [Pelagibacterium luteolum]|uniref:L,D-transpeptidase catalytic domain n=1 Tax=Pelagibacterium luteolum TaxID=440168 RepID=A0A1G7U123_9HYPH|nr:L,D-transpeptidase [Pelagibacterium luteolum]SDG41236.1 L,D-transpeptidase catalytic domain [Pelagibacterium luteolum]